MFNCKRVSELSGANIRNQWLRQVKARLKLVTASQRAISNTSFTDPRVVVVKLTTKIAGQRRNMTTIKDREGKRLVNEDEVLERWREPFEGVLNVSRPDRLCKK